MSTAAALVLAAGLAAGANPAPEGAQSTGEGSSVRAAAALPAPLLADPAADENRAPSARSALGATSSGRTAQSITPGTFQYARVLGTDFQPRTSATTYAYNFNGCIYNVAGSDNRFVAHVDLPQGAILKYARFYFDDTSAPIDMTLWLTKYQPGVTSVDITSVSSSGSAGYGTTLSPEINPTNPPTEIVDNTSWSYALIVAPNALGAATSFCGARVAYFPPPDGHFTAIAPCRVVDTRGGAPLGGGYLPASTERVYVMAGVCGIPANATGVSLNATATTVAGPGFLSLWQTGTAYPTVSTLNFNLGETQVNAAIVPLNASGQLSVAFGVNGGHLILDVNGYYY
ncbi:MAG TPA: hypothetical protein PLB01_04410 [Thermoanaerobaculia bacterium]|nr:hypothetical protein [Thermoanaerobaculia bacterium]